MDWFRGDVVNRRVCMCLYMNVNQFANSFILSLFLGYELFSVVCIGRTLINLVCGTSNQ